MAGLPPLPRVEEEDGFDPFAVLFKNHLYDNRLVFISNLPRGSDDDLGAELKRALLAFGDINVDEGGREEFSCGAKGFAFVVSFML